jgi:hypothetical protein
LVNRCALAIDGRAAARLAPAVKVLNLRREAGLFFRDFSQSFIVCQSHIGKLLFYILLLYSDVSLLKDSRYFN